MRGVAEVGHVGCVEQLAKAISVSSSSGFRCPLANDLYMVIILLGDWSLHLLLFVFEHSSQTIIGLFWVIYIDCIWSARTLVKMVGVCRARHDIDCVQRAVGVGAEMCVGDLVL